MISESVKQVYHLSDEWKRKISKFLLFAALTQPGGKAAALNPTLLSQLDKPASSLEALLEEATKADEPTTREKNGGNCVGLKVQMLLSHC